MRGAMDFKPWGSEARGASRGRCREQAAELGIQVSRPEPVSKSGTRYSAGPHPQACLASVSVPKPRGQSRMRAKLVTLSLFRGFQLSTWDGGVSIQIINKRVS